jgi:hypothetical protein
MRRSKSLLPLLTHMRRQRGYSIPSLPKTGGVACNGKAEGFGGREVQSMRRLCSIA